MNTNEKSVVISGKSVYEEYSSLSQCSTKAVDSFVLSTEGNQELFFNDFLSNKLKELEPFDDNGDCLISADD